MSDPALENKRRGLPLRVKMRHEPHFVEELAVRHETAVGKLVPLSSIEPNPDQPRSVLGDLNDLVASIRDKGVLEPLLVRPLQSDDEARSEGKIYRIIAGERRYRAALEVGLFEVPVIEMAVTDEEALEIALLENLQRKDLTPFEEAEGFQALADIHGYTHEQIAETMGRSRSSVTETVGLLAMPARVRQAAEAAGLDAKSILLEVLKLKDEPAMLALIERAAALGMGRDEVRREAKSLRGRGRGAERRKPYVFKFRAPNKNYSLALSFRQSEVERTDLIRALEEILEQLRSSQE